MKITRRGFALISTLLFLGILFMMSVSIIMMSRQRVFSGLVQHHKSQALYLAEAGLAKAEVALESDLKWPGEPNGTVDGIPGTYEIHLAKDLNDRNGSVINIGTDTPADSYRGKNSVPKNSALLIVTANVSGQTYTLEALVRGKGTAGYMSDAILGSGNVVAKGNLQVDGISALDDAKKVDGSIQSNDKSGSNNVVWQGSPGDTAHVTGNVGVGGASSGIKMAGAKVDGSFEANAPTNIPHTDIDSEVAKNMGNPSPSLVPLGTTTLGTGKYSSGTINLDGDMVLKDGAVLYVNGDLKINGSISGKGTIYVTGDTTFRGDSKVTTNPDYSVALYSKGDVSLRGFDGTAYLEALGANVELNNIHSALTLLADKASKLPISGAPYKAANTDLQEYWSAMETLGAHKDGTNQMGLLNAKLSSAPDGETKTFLDKKIGILDKQFSSANIATGDNSNTVETTMTAYKNGETLGILDIYGQLLQYGEGDPSKPWNMKTNPGPKLFGVNANDLSQSMQNLIAQTNFDKLGTSYFQGAIYTQGHFVADNEVTIVGALMADGPSGGAAGAQRRARARRQDSGKFHHRPGRAFRHDHRGHQYGRTRGQH